MKTTDESSALSPEWTRWTMIYQELESVCSIGLSEKNISIKTTKANYVLSPELTRGRNIDYEL